MESGFKCGSGEPGSSFCVMMDILYHVPHLCGGFFAIFNELNRKSLRLSVNDSFAGKTIMEYIKTRAENGISVVRTWTPPSDAPISSNGCWVFFIIRFFDSNNYVYTKILSFASDTEGDTANAWLGSVDSSDAIKWKAL